MKYSDNTLFFYGSPEEWDNLIIKNFKNSKSTYVFDPFTYKGKYPEGINSIKSMPTALRFLGVRLDGAFIYLNSLNLKIARKFLYDMNCYRRFSNSYFIIRGDQRDLTHLLLNKCFNLCCRRNIDHLKLYK